VQVHGEFGASSHWLRTFTKLSQLRRDGNMADRKLQNGSRVRLKKEWAGTLANSQIISKIGSMQDGVVEDWNPETGVYLFRYRQGSASQTAWVPAMIVTPYENG
jgi:hypothetical protein